MNRSTPGLPVHHQLPESTQTHVHWVSNAIQPSHPLLSPSPPTLNLSQHQGLFKWISSSHQVAKYWSFSFNISPSYEHPGLICFRMDWLDLLAVQGTLKSLLQHHSSKASILLGSAFLLVQLSHPYMTTGKAIALTRWTFVGKVMSLLFNMLSRLVITVLPRSNFCNIGRSNPSTSLNFMAKITICSDSGAQKNKVSHCFHCFPIYHMDHSLVLLNETKPCQVRPPKTDRSWWRDLTECGLLQNGIANHFNILALRTPWTVWKELLKMVCTYFVD